MKLLKALIWICIIVAVGTGVLFYPQAVSRVAESSLQQIDDVLQEFVGSFRENDDGAQGDDDDDDIPSRMVVVNGSLAVKLTDAEQKASGLQLQALQQVEQLIESRAQARVVNIAPLLELRSRYHKTSSEDETATAELVLKRQTLARLKQLNKEQGNIASRKLQQAQAELIAIQARQQRARYEMEYLRNEAIQEWGTTIISWALDKVPDKFNQLLSHEMVLLLLVLRPAEQLPEDVSFVFVDRDINRQQQRKAFLVSESPRTSINAQGETWFFQTRGEHLRTDMRLTAWIPQSLHAKKGIHIPNEAVVWYAGKPWVYVQHDDELFSRRSIVGQQQSGAGWFVQNVLGSDDKVVTSGAQMLLSEEFRWQIPDEDEDM